MKLCCTFETLAIQADKEADSKSEAEALSEWLSWAQVERHAAVLVTRPGSSRPSKVVFPEYANSINRKKD